MVDTDTGEAWGLLPECSPAAHHSNERGHKSNNEDGDSRSPDQLLSPMITGDVEELVHFIIRQEPDPNSHQTQPSQLQPWSTRSIKLANFCGNVKSPEKIGCWNRWTMTHGLFYRLQLRTTSVSWIHNSKSKKWCMHYFFPHLMNENKHYRVTSNHHGNINKICWPISR